MFQINIKYELFVEIDLLGRISRQFCLVIPSAYYYYGDYCTNCLIKVIYFN